MTESEKQDRKAFNEWFKTLKVQKKVLICDIEDVWMGWRARSLSLEKPEPESVRDNWR